MHCPSTGPMNDQNLQNELDAETIYNVIETGDCSRPTSTENKDGVATEWVQYVKNIIADVAPEYTMKRMLDHYYERFYDKLYDSIPPGTSGQLQAGQGPCCLEGALVTRQWPEVKMHKSRLVRCGSITHCRSVRISRLK